MVLRGIDISSHQGDGGMNWSQVVRSRAQFVVVKATGGTRYQNEYYAMQVAAARALGAVVGHYHYAHELTLHAGQGLGPDAEADNFVQNSDVRPGEFVVLDIEDPAAKGNLADFVLRFAARVEALLGCTIFLYTYPNYMQVHGLDDPRLRRFPLWWASYSIPYQDTKPEHTPPWALTVWQWSGGTPVAGFNFPTDENIFYGSREELVALGRPGQVAVAVVPFQHAIGFMSPIMDSFHWGAGSAGIVTERTIKVYNDESKRWYVGTWKADTGITWVDVTPK